MSYTATLRANQTSQPFPVGAGSLITIAPNTVGTGNAEYTRASAAQIQNGQATWTAWVNGTVSTTTIDASAFPLFARFNCLTGSIIGTVGDPQTVPSVIVASVAPTNADGLPNGTVWIQTV